jgi:hypothetical protein
MIVMMPSPGGPIANFIDWFKKEPAHCIASTVAALIGIWFVATLIALTLSIAFS